MAARAIWKGVIVVDEGLRVAVRFFSAVEDRSVHFRLLHERDRVPISQRMVNPDTGKPVPSERIRKGLELEEGVFVLLDKEEIASTDPEPSREIEVTRFVPAGSIPAQYYDRPYWLGHDQDRESYLALARALEASATEGVLRWTMRRKRYSGTLRSVNGHLSVVTLRPAAEVVAAADLEAPPGREPRAGERRMAEQLVAALEGPFEPTEFRDEHRERVLELIENKRRGRKIDLPRAERPAAAERSLEGALAASLRAARRKRKTA